MAYEPKDGDFVLNINKRKQTAKHADYTGYIRQGGKKFFLNGWIKENKETSEEFISGNVGNEMTSQRGSASAKNFSGFPGRKAIEEVAPAAPAPSCDPLDDSIPF